MLELVGPRLFRIKKVFSQNETKSSVIWGVQPNPETEIAFEQIPVCDRASMIGSSWSVQLLASSFGKRKERKLVEVMRCSQNDA